ncbi:MAG: hypothetical protein PHE50_09925 [Dehalococcoidales bacterium]|nr:hypothetical protein [Dehalococcoidales bacterium]
MHTPANAPAHPKAVWARSGSKKNPDKPRGKGVYPVCWLAGNRRNDGAGWLAGYSKGFWSNNLSVLVTTRT